ncbi:hypothetical protein [Blastococcus brunescens]|uniref:Uncharacterized protein n=1 Tax=Blastococcus brunescens TaxID=1564165 RepID=A0ABZ1AUW7_9ACTN|nr:hypothetical protein [Blastococcus sp. BMG 8361]WRL62368.1 hypothetical protein U6N30_20400 [Blastococcus sp. BMG 8361]
MRGSLPIGGGAVGSPRLSAGSSRPSNTAEKTASNTGSCARSVTSAIRQVQYRAGRSSGGTSCSARARPAARSGGAGRPARCSAVVSPTARGRARP